jgi:hypothetical protein
MAVVEPDAHERCLAVLRIRIRSGMHMTLRVGATDDEREPWTMGGSGIPCKSGQGARMRMLLFLSPHGND